MNIVTEGIILSKIKFGETSNIITLFSKNYGLLRGLLKGACLKKDKYINQLGNIVNINWKARLDTQLGVLKLDLKDSVLPQIFNNQNKLLVLLTITEIINKFLPEREVDLSLYNATKNLIMILKIDNFFENYINWELFLLKSLGYGLDFSMCGQCNKVEKLKYVSPKTGIAVCEKIGHPYKHQLLKLPEFICNKDFLSEIKSEDKKLALELTGYFIKKFCNNYNINMSKNRDKLVNIFYS